MWRLAHVFGNRSHQPPSSCPVSLATRAVLLTGLLTKTRTGRWPASSSPFISHSQRGLNTRITRFTNAHTPSSHSENWVHWDICIFIFKPRPSQALPPPLWSGITPGGVVEPNVMPWIEPKWATRKTSTLRSVFSPGPICFLITYWRTMGE